ncbi:hypothetical protein [Altererythrobacter sp. ZODW24]|uniref:hypothetical protein n=1 Tax=Altererythrobacter sp. ZODW24 TaxID=2185142 RepID=UPI0013B36BF5|nr:hypothetical protein [Altererythrobacter sp. ZODW24]
MERETSVGGILSETFALLSDTAREIALFVLVVGGVSAIGVALGYVESTNEIMGFGGGVVIEPGDSIMSGLYQIGAAVLSVVASYFLLTKLLDTRGRLGEGDTRIWAYVGMTILSAIGIVLGFVLLIIPGILLMVRWSASSGFLIGGRKGVTESLSASWDATSGHGWTIFLAGLVMLIALFFVGGIFGGAAGVAGNFQVVAIVSALVEAFGTAVSLCFGIAVYLLVGTDDREIGEVFE